MILTPTLIGHYGSPKWDMLLSDDLREKATAFLELSIVFEKMAEYAFGEMDDSDPPGMVFQKHPSHMFRPFVCGLGPLKGFPHPLNKGS